MKWRGGKRGCHPPPPLCAAREFLPRVPRPAWPSHGLRLGDPLCLLVNTPTPPEKCTSPPTRLPSGGHGIHRTHAATEEGILPRQASVIRGSLPLAPFLPSPFPGPGLARSRSRPRGTYQPPPGSAATGGDSSRIGKQAAFDCRASGTAL